MNYTQLTQAIIAYAESDEQLFVENIPVFVKIAERRIYDSVQLAYLRKNVNAQLTANNKWLSAPNDFLSVYELSIVLPNGDYEYLINKDTNFIRQAYPNTSYVGSPKYYAIFGPTTTSGPSPSLTNELSFELGPTPDLNYEVRLHYFFYPESIVTAGTTWLGDNAESALLYGALREAAVFQKGEADVVAMYEQKYMESLALLKQLGDGKERQDAYRSGQFRMPVR